MYRSFLFLPDSPLFSNSKLAQWRRKCWILKNEEKSQNFPVDLPSCSNLIVRTGAQHKTFPVIEGSSFCLCVGAIVSRLILCTLLRHRHASSSPMRPDTGHFGSSPSSSSLSCCNLIFSCSCLFFSCCFFAQFLVGMERTYERMEGGRARVQVEGRSDAKESIKHRTRELARFYVERCWRAGRNSFEY